MQTTLEQFSNTLQAYTDACNGRRSEYAETTTFDNRRDFQAAARLLNVHAVLANRTKIFGKDSKNGDKSLWLTINTKKITIEYRKPQPANVRDSSREAYAGLDLSSLQNTVAECILRASANDGDITRAEIAHNLDKGLNSITGRVTELLKMSETGTIAINGTHYRLVELPQHRLSRCPKASKVKCNALRMVMRAPANYQPAAPAAQTTMF